MHEPPVAPREPSVRKIHGQTDIDDYAWMRDPEHPALADYLAAERDYDESCAERLGDLTDRLAAESTGRIPAGPDDGVGWPLGGFVYRTRTPDGRENLQFLRSMSGDSAEQVLLDENIISAGSDYIDVAERLPSPDGALLAWAADLTGAEIYQLRIRDLSAGADLPDLIERSYPGLAWSADAGYLCYLVPDGLNRPYQVWRHQLGTPAEADALLYTESDARFELTMRGSRSGQFAIIESASRDTTEVRLIPLADPLAEPVLVRSRQRGVEYHVDHARSDAPGGGWLFIVTDEDDPEFTLKRAEVGSGRWVPVDCAASAGARLLSCDVVGQRLVLTLRRDGEPLLVVTDHDGGSVVEVGPGVAAGSIRIDHAEDYDAGSVILVEESLIEPPAWYRLDLASGERQLLKRRDVPGYDP